LHGDSNAEALRADAHDGHREDDEKDVYHRLADPDEDVRDEKPSERGRELSPDADDIRGHALRNARKIDSRNDEQRSAR
jgi:hypothetical protein